jgi:malonyl-CoA O-methyltransferase
MVLILDLLNLPRLDKAAVKKSFNRAATSYNKAGVLQDEVLSRLLGRLQYVRLDPASAIDIGCGTGRGVAGLQKIYSGAKVIGLDMAYSMLQETKKQFRLLSRKRMINADMERLPIGNNCFDLMFSCLALQWANDLNVAFQEAARIGKPGGLFMFATFGPSTLIELRDSWFEVDQRPHVHQFIDMHDIGDSLMKAGFSQPVVDAEIIKLEYNDFRQVLNDLKNIGASNADKNRNKGLMTPGRLKKLEAAYREKGFQDGKFIASYEVIYGHAWINEAFPGV